jgi:hypothetical protein
MDVSVRANVAPVSRNQGEPPNDLHRARTGQLADSVIIGTRRAISDSVTSRSLCWASKRVPAMTNTLNTDAVLWRLSGLSEYSHPVRMS